VSDSERRWAWPVLATVLLAAIGVRIWGVAQGLPFVYNLDEADHFVPRAVAMFRHGSLNPHYFANPPALTYLLHAVFAVWFGGSHGVQQAYARDPHQVYVLARVFTALLGVLAVWLLYLLGARLCDRATGLLAAAIEAFAFLPVFYSHLALNDVPTLAPLTLSLLGSAGVLRKGRRRDYLVAGGALGLACATKYTAGIALLPLLAATVARARGARGGPGARSWRGAVLGVALAGAAAIAAFLIANPYSILDLHAFRHELARESTLAAEAQGKLGAPRDGGLVYYLWSLTWGLGWVPALAALAGAVLAWRRESALGWLLVPAPVAFLLFMGVQGRYFGRWLLPVFPLLCVLAAIAGLAAVGAVARRAPRLRWAALALVVIALVGQGAVYSAHSSLVLARADTRSQVRDWMVANVPAGSRIVVEPIVPNAWLTDPGQGAAGEPRWIKYPALTLAVDPATGRPPSRPVRVRAEDYVRTLSPALIAHYEQLGYCWVVTGSTEAGRAYAARREVPAAVAYYDELARVGRLVHHVSPYGRGRGPVPFGFDWSFDYYPLAYARPGPAVSVYRLTGGACAG
jgi:hypothetical protein